MKSENQNQQQILEIGYYPIRGKAQVPRLLLEYIKVPYVDKLFQLQQWNDYKKTQLESWDFPDLPYLIDRNPFNQSKYQEPFIVTEAFPICEYIIQKYGYHELLGKNLNDKATIQMYLWTIDTMGSIISINCSKKAENQTLEQFKQNQWKNSVLPRLEKYENFSRFSNTTNTIAQKDKKWFLGYLTIIDFSIYELVRYIDMLFPGNLGNIPRLKYITDQISQLPQIEAYQKSERSVKEMDPSVLLKRLHKKE